MVCYILSWDAIQKVVPELLMKKKPGIIAAAKTQAQHGIQDFHLPEGICASG
jgi:hypothetical protein